MSRNNYGVSSLAAFTDGTHPGAGVGIIEDHDGAPLSTFSKYPTTIRCWLTCSTAGDISYNVAVGGSGIKVLGGLSVDAGTEAIFDIPVESGDVVDIYHSGSGTITRCIVREI